MYIDLHILARLAIIDDHALVREGIKAILKKARNIEVAWEAETLVTGFQMLTRIPPDLILLDLGLPDGNGMELIRNLKKDSSPIKIIVITATEDVNRAIEVLKIGVDGYFLKSSVCENLLFAVNLVLQGKSYIDPCISGALFKRLAMGLASNKDRADLRYENLTKREKEVFKLLAEGHPVKEAAFRLSISPKTCENHKVSLQRKLDLHSPIEIIRFAARIGIVDLGLDNHPEHHGAR